MREILFKAKSIDKYENGNWVEGYLFNDGYENGRMFIGSLEIQEDKDSDWAVVGTCFYEIDPKTICQYVGLTDKNGNKIWENDVVEVTYRDIRFAENYTEIGFIKYFSRSASYRYVLKEETWNFDCTTEIEVIGNIFDNPELIKERD